MTTKLTRRLHCSLKAIDKTFSFKRQKKDYMVLFLSIMFLCNAYNAFAQTKTISGTDTDATVGDPLPGVTILANDTIEGTSTNVIKKDMSVEKFKPFKLKHINKR
ncbi:carboxypeptidase-like regulatory domain-containing protein [Aestuariivivens sediminis]|uniref:carboxypeptidase-like regulatory domain-containing protein n=1 Tax=Aestuariivivens sediminis TaxID=2913557 RepID=UPI001F5932D2|nr:carboxypeptidase-like regulatory domain-containing protein [Aestuariivivens sediminis]